MKIILLAHTLRITNNSFWTGRIIGTEALMSVMTSCTREGVLGMRNLCGVYERICRVGRTCALALLEALCLGTWSQITMRYTYET